MSIMAKTPSGYKKIGSAYLGERPVDKVFNANGDVVYALQRELTGVPPLLFKGKEQSNLSNYRIYGDTVDGNSVGDLVESGEHAGEYVVPVTVEGKNLFDGEIEQGGYDNYGLNVDNELRLYRVRGTNYIPVVGGETYNLHAVSISPLMYHISYYTKNDYTTQRFGYVGWTQNTVFTTPSDCKYIRLLFKTLKDSVITPDDISNVMLNAGSTALPYEPYHAPVTTPIYLPEPIKMVGDEAEYIDYAEQKQHRVRKNLWDGEIESGSWMGFNADDEPYKVDYNFRCRSSKLIAVKNSSVYTISNHEPSTNVQVIVQYRDNNNKFINEYGWADFPCTFTTPSNAAFIEFIIRKPSNLGIMPEDCGDIQLELGSTATEYEPYIENTDLDVTLPALPTIKGTNVLSVGTAVQPSRMDIEGRIKTLT